MPLFQHRHYVAIAKAISDSSDVSETTPTVRALMDLFARDNMAFSYERFRLACTGQPYPRDRDTPTPSPLPAPRRLYWVASVGRDGLNVSFQRSRGEWLSDCAEGNRGERSGMYDQVVSGWEDV